MIKCLLALRACHFYICSIVTFGAFVLCLSVEPSVLFFFGPVCLKTLPLPKYLACVFFSFLLILILETLWRGVASCRAWSSAEMKASCCQSMKKLLHMKIIKGTNNPNCHSSTPHLSSGDSCWTSTVLMLSLGVNWPDKVWSALQIILAKRHPFRQEV